MARLRLLWRWLDVPAGAVLGVYSGTMIILTWVGFFLGKDFPDGSVTAYLGVVAGYTGTKLVSKSEKIEPAPGAQGDGHD